MTSQWKLAVKSATPPVLWNAASQVKNALFSRRTSVAEHGEKDATWYDQAYIEVGDYHLHYTASHYYFLWSVVADRLLRAKASSVIDIGCGSGQVASLLRDKGIPRYCGLDLSEQAIRQAKSVCPEYSFVSGSVFGNDLIERLDYDAAISLEFLEHVEEDIGVLLRIPKGRRVIATVPNFPYVSHVRHFSAPDEVVHRYASMFGDFRVDTFLGDANGKAFYLFEGVRS